MKKIILSLAIVGGLLTCSTSLNAFTAVTSGAWSNALTWGGIAPGSSVSNQDIIIPSGITVDMDMDVQFNGLLNSFFVTGTLSSTGINDLEIVNGTLTGSGSITAGKLTLGTASAIYSFTGPVTVDVFRNAGTAISIMSLAVVKDTLDLEAGAFVLSSGGTLQMMSNSNVRINNGVFTNNGGVFVTGVPYDVWYYGTTKITGEELNSATTHNVNIMLNSNSEDVILTTNALVNGDLNMMVGHVALNAMRLWINGDLIRNSGSQFESSGVSDLVISGGVGPLTSTVEFAAPASIDELIIDRGTTTVLLNSDLTITGVLRLTSGNLHVDNLSTLTMGVNSTVNRIAGALVVDGTFDGTQNYQVVYDGDSLTTGVELSGSGLQSLYIDLWLSQRLVVLTQDLVIPGNFELLNGQFVLDTFDIEFQGTYNQVYGSEIWSSSLTTMKFSMSTVSNDTLWLRPQAYPMYNLIVDIPTNSKLVLGAAIGTANLTLMSGKIDAYNSILRIGGVYSTVYGANDSTYILVTGTGWLQMNVPVNTFPYTEFPVGTPSHYAPVSIKQSSPGTMGYFSVKVYDGVYSDGLSGTNVSTTDAVVNKTWVIMADSAVVYNMDVRAGWVGASEMNGFDRQNCYIKNYYNNMWDSYPSAAAAPASSNTYTVERMLLQNGGDFVVVDNSSPLVVTEVANPESDVYPNPATDYINVNLSNPSNDHRQYEIYDAAGRLVTSFENANEQNQIDLRNYDNGSYTLRVTNLTTNEVTTRLIIKS